MCRLETDLPGHADIADMVSLIAAAGEALLHRPLRPVAAALSAGRNWAPVHRRQPSAGYVLTSVGFYQLSKDISFRIQKMITFMNLFLTKE